MLPARSPLARFIITRDSEITDKCRHCIVASEIDSTAALPARSIPLHCCQRDRLHRCAASEIDSIAALHVWEKKGEGRHDRKAVFHVGVMTVETPALTRSREAAVTLLHKPGSTVESSVSPHPLFYVDAHLSLSNTVITILITRQCVIYLILSLISRSESV